MSGLVFIISAPSGTGKTTVTNELMKVVPNLQFSVSFTTRQPRGSEIDGRDYFFISRAEFDAMLRRDEFLEHADVFGEYYGTARRFLDKAWDRGKDLVLDIDVQGAAQVKAKMPDAISIFILPPSREVLEKRLRMRSQAEHVNSEEKIQRRLQAARREIENYRKYDYIVVNDRLEESVPKLKAIVAAERAWRSGAEPSLHDVQLAERCRLNNADADAERILETFGATPGPKMR